jgi:hypothetical protein
MTQALVSIEPFIQWVGEIFLSGLSDWGVNLTTYFHQMAK